MSYVQTSLATSLENIRDSISWLDDAWRYAYSSREYSDDARETMLDCLHLLYQVRADIQHLVDGMK